MSQPSRPGPPRLKLFGVPTLTVGARPPRVLERVEAALFAMLALDGPTRTDVLAPLLWQGLSGSDSGVNLRDLRRKLRKALGRECMTRCADGLLLDADVENELAVLTGPHAPPAELPRGVFLQGCEYPDRPDLQGWVDDARQRAGLLLKRAKDHAVRRLVEDRCFYDALRLAGEMLREEPLVEDHYVRLASVYWAQGDRSGARGVLDSGRVVLARELGVEPGPAMQRLEANLLHVGVLPSAPTREPPTAWLRPGPFVGRGEELARALAAWGAGLPVVLEGEAGIGKSRFLVEFCRRRPDAVYVKCMFGDEQQPFGALSRLIEALPAPVLLTCSEADRAELARLWSALGPPSGHPPFLPRLLTALRGALKAVMAAKVRGLVIDDLHWADAGSVDILLQLASEVDGLGPHWLLATRTAARMPLLSAWTAAHADRCARILLPALSAPDIEAFMRELGFAARPASAWAHSFARHGMGNPRYLRERLIASWLASGDRILRDDKPNVQDIQPGDTLLDLVTARLAHMSDDALALARTAALAGPDFSAALAEVVLHKDTNELIAPWNELVEAQVLHRGQIADNVMREAIAHRIPPELAMRLHARIADAGVELQLAAARIAEHRLAAEQFRQAGESFAQAARQFEAACSKPDELLMWDRAAAAYASAPDAHDAAFQAQWAAVVPALERETVDAARARAQALLVAARDDRQRGASHLALARAAREANDLPTCIHHARQAFAYLSVNAAVEAGPALSAACLLLPALSLARLQDEARSVFEQLAELTDQALTYRERIDLHNAQATYAAIFGPAEAAVASFRAGLQLAREADDWTQINLFALNLAANQSLNGDPVAALRSTRVAESTCRKMGKPLGPSPGWSAMWKGALLAQSGRYGAALRHLNDAISHQRDKPGAEAWLVDAECTLARTLLTLGQPDLARAALRTLPAVGSQPAQSRLSVELQIAFETGAAADLDPHELVRPDRQGRLEKSLVNALHASRLLDAAEGAEAAAALCAEAAATGMASLLQFARLVLASRLADAAEEGQAAEVLDVLLIDLERRQPATAYLPEAWLVAYQVYSRVGRHDEAVQSLQCGMQWVMGALAKDMPNQFRASFMEHNRVNRDLFRANAWNRLNGGPTTAP